MDFGYNYEVFIYIPVYNMFCLDFVLAAWQTANSLNISFLL